MECRSRAIPEQFATLLKFMESHGDIARHQQGPYARIKADKLWLELEGILNTTPGGVVRSTEKWKKVWADWKAKTKKKALTKRGEASGNGGGPSSRQSLNALEVRLLGIMGLTAVIGKAGIEERSFAALPSERNFLPAPTNTIQIVHRVCPSQPDFEPDETQATSLASTPTSPTSLPSPSGEIPSPAPSPPPSTASPPMASATSPTPSTTRGTPQRRRHHASPSPAASTSRRRGLLRAHTCRVKTQFLQVMSELVAIKNRQLQLDVEREKKLHERELERLRLESQRIQMVENQNIILNRLAGTVDKLIEILPHLSS